MWLYLGSVFWYDVATRQPVDLLSLAEGTVSVGILVYGITAVHRLFWANLLPGFYHTVGTLRPVPGVVAWVFHAVALSILLVSIAVVLWGWFHAHREDFSLRRHFPTAFLLAAPLVTYELLRSTTGVDIFEVLVAAFLRIL